MSSEQKDSLIQMMEEQRKEIYSIWKVTKCRTEKRKLKKINKYLKRLNDGK